MPKVVVISGSPSDGSRLNGVLQSIQSQLSTDGIDTEWINVRNLPPEDLIPQKGLEGKVILPVAIGFFFVLQF